MKRYTVERLPAADMGRPWVVFRTFGTFAAGGGVVGRYATEAQAKRRARDCEWNYKIAEANAYAIETKNPLLGLDPDDIAEAWHGARDWADQKFNGELTARQCDKLADEILTVWTGERLREKMKGGCA